MSTDLQTYVDTWYNAKTLLPISHVEAKDDPVLCELCEKVISNSTFKPVSR